VTNAEFVAFVAATGYVTLAERPFDPALYPDALPELAVPGALLFRMMGGPVDTRNVHDWWHYVPGASWHRRTRALRWFHRTWPFCDTSPGRLWRVAVRHPAAIRRFVTESAADSESA